MRSGQLVRRRTSTTTMPTFRILHIAFAIYLTASAWAVSAQTVDELIATCGGLPTRLAGSVQVDLAPQVRTDLAAECANWSGIRGCCSAIASQTQANASKALVDSLKHTWGSDKRERHCFAGYHDKRCDLAVHWTKCAQVCDTLFPRDAVTGLPKTDANCYELFSAPRGIDRVLMGGPATACARAQQITDLGDCNSITVVGELPQLGNNKQFVIEEANIAVAVGKGKAICVRGSAAQAQLTVSVLLVLTIGSLWNISAAQ